MSAEPQTRYCTTGDGVRIAYAVSGAGPPLIYLSPLVGHLTADWNFPHERRRFEWLGRAHSVVRLDIRGSGLSQRQSFGSFDYGADLDAVVEDLSLEPFVLCAPSTSGPAAIAYTVAHPDRVRGLVLLNAWASPMGREPRIQAVHGLIETDWVMFTETMSRLVGAWIDDEDARQYAAILREATTPENYNAYREHLAGISVAPLLPSVRRPTLIIHNKAGVVPLSAAQELASGIPGSQARFIDRASVFYDLSAPDIAPWLEEFLLDGRSVGALDSPLATTRAIEHATGTAVILFTDIVSSTVLTEHMGDIAFRDASRTLDTSLRAAIRDAGGAAVEGKLLGDGVLATFPSAAQAIDGARRCLALSTASELGLHIGLHAGDVIREDNNLYGGAVNIASRICGLSGPGEILVSDVVRGMARSSAGVEFEDRGEQEMKGVGEPVRVYAVGSQQ